MHRIDEGPAYTKGNSFRAIAETRARKYRADNLQLRGYDRWGHVLTKEDADSGWNFLPSLKDDILREVKKRADKGKGVDFDRTSRNMLSSQAMCFNLFAPLNRDRRLAAELLGSFIDGIGSVDDMEYEHTPHNSIFGDQSGTAGVDCDALFDYTDSHGRKGLAIIETKYVEPEFSLCGFRRSDQKDPCPTSTIINQDYSNCRYHYKKNYNYWRIAEESGVYRMEEIRSRPCPFGGPLWQLWTNLSMAYALARDKGYSAFTYAVICPEGNTELTQGNRVFSDFASLLRMPDVFKVIHLEDIGRILMNESSLQKPELWVSEFVDRYCWGVAETRSSRQ